MAASSGTLPPPMEDPDKEGEGMDEEEFVLVQGKGDRQMSFVWRPLAVTFSLGKVAVAPDAEAEEAEEEGTPDEASSSSLQMLPEEVVAELTNAGEGDYGVPMTVITVETLKEEAEKVQNNAGAPPPPEEGDAAAAEMSQADAELKTLLDEMQAENANGNEESPSATFTAVVVAGLLKRIVAADGLTAKEVEVGQRQAAVDQATAEEEEANSALAEAESALQEAEEASVAEEVATAMEAVAEAKGRVGRAQASVEEANEKMYEPCSSRKLYILDDIVHSAADAADILSLGAPLRVCATVSGEGWSMGTLMEEIQYAQETTSTVQSIQSVKLISIPSKKLKTTENETAEVGGGDSETEGTDPGEEMSLTSLLMDGLKAAGDAIFAYDKWRSNVSLVEIPEEGSDVGVVDTQYMSKLLDSVPNEKISPAVVLHCMLEQVARSEGADGEESALADNITTASSFIEDIFSGLDKKSASSCSPSGPEKEKPLDVPEIEAKMKSFISHAGVARHLMPPTPTMTEENRSIRLTEYSSALASTAEGLSTALLSRYLLAKEAALSLSSETVLAAHSTDIETRNCFELLSADAAQNLLETARLYYPDSSIGYNELTDTLAMTFHCDKVELREELSIPHLTTLNDWSPTKEENEGEEEEEAVVDGSGTSGDMYTLRREESLLSKKRNFCYSAGGDTIVDYASDTGSDALMAAVRCRGTALNLKKVSQDKFVLEGVAANGCTFAIQVKGESDDSGFLDSVQCAAPSGEVVEMMSSGNTILGSVVSSSTGQMPDLSKTSSFGFNTTLREFMSSGKVSSDTEILFMPGAIIAKHSSGVPIKLLFPDGTSAERSPPEEIDSEELGEAWTVTKTDGVRFVKYDTNPWSAPEEEEKKGDGAPVEGENSAVKLHPISVAVVTDPDSGAIVTSRDDLSCHVAYPDGRQLAIWPDGLRVATLRQGAYCFEGSGWLKATRIDEETEVAVMEDVGMKQNGEEICVSLADGSCVRCSGGLVEFTPASATPAAVISKDIEEATGRVVFDLFAGTATVCDAEVPIAIPPRSSLEKEGGEEAAAMSSSVEGEGASAAHDTSEDTDGSSPAQATEKEGITSSPGPDIDGGDVEGVEENAETECNDAVQADTMGTDGCKIPPRVIFIQEGGHGSELLSAATFGTLHSRAKRSKKLILEDAVEGAGEDGVVSHIFVSQTFGNEYSVPSPQAMRSESAPYPRPPVHAIPSFHQPSQFQMSSEEAAHAMIAAAAAKGYHAGEGESENTFAVRLPRIAGTQIQRHEMLSRKTSRKGEEKKTSIQQIIVYPERRAETIDNLKKAVQWHSEWAASLEETAVDLPKDGEAEEVSAAISARILEARKDYETVVAAPPAETNQEEEDSQTEEEEEKLSDESSAIQRTPHKRPDLSDPGPQRPLPGLTLKYFDSYEYTLNTRKAPAPSRDAASVLPPPPAPTEGKQKFRVAAEPVTENAYVEEEVEGEDEEEDMDDAEEEEEEGDEEGGSEFDETFDNSLSGTSLLNTRYLEVEDDSRRSLRTVSASQIKSRGIMTQFKVTPDPALGDLHLGRLEKGGVISCPIKLHNISPDGGRFTVVLPRPPLRANFKPGFVAAGMHTTIDIELSDSETLPLQEGLYSQVLVIKTEYNIFSWNVTADIVNTVNGEGRNAAKEEMSDEVAPPPSARGGGVSSTSLDPNLTLEEIKARDSRLGVAI